MNDDIIDLNEFLDRVQGDKELLVELFDIFIQDFQDKRNVLKEAVVKKDFEQIKSVAHSLKGASGNISAKPLRATFLQLEEMIKTNQWKDAEQILTNMDRQFSDLQKCINEIKTQFKNE